MERMRILFVAFSIILAQASLAPCMAAALGRTILATEAAIRLCPGDHCLTVRVAKTGSEITVYESQNGWFRLSPYKSTGVPNLKVAEWVRQGDTRATAVQIASWAKNENVNLLATADRKQKDATATKTARRTDTKRAAEKVRSRRTRRSRVSRKRQSMDKLYSNHLIVSGECKAIAESGKSKTFKNYYFFLCDNDLFYRLRTRKQIWTELQRSKISQ